jgi:hypothetical protein
MDSSDAFNAVAEDLKCYIHAKAGSVISPSLRALIVVVVVVVDRTGGASSSSRQDRGC